MMRRSRRSRRLTVNIIEVAMVRVKDYHSLPDHLKTLAVFAFF
jgi:hypothetical protein